MSLFNCFTQQSMDKCQWLAYYTVVLIRVLQCLIVQDKNIKQQVLKQECYCAFTMSPYKIVCKVVSSTWSSWQPQTILNKVNGEQSKLKDVSKWEWSLKGEKDWLNYMWLTTQYTDKLTEHRCFLEG